MNKNILVTGSKGNLGQAVLSKFLNNGYKVISTVHSANDIELIEQHPLLTVFELDVTDAAACNHLVKKITSDFLKIDAALFLVGGYEAGTIHNTTIGDIEKQIQLNFVSAFNLAQPVFEKMMLQPSGGRIIFVGSKPGLYAGDAKRSLAYGFSKALLFQLAEVINIEGKKKNVTASVIVPSTMDTPANRKAMPDAEFSLWVSPDEVADAMEFICSERGNSLRETVLKVYGGA